MELGQTIQLKIEEFDVEGKGVSHYLGKTIFVLGAIKGEEVVAKIEAISRNVVFAKTIKVINQSEDRITPICEHYENCGGCDLMHINYETELKVKRLKVIKTLKKIANLSPIVNETILANTTLNYRNKSIVPFQEENDEIVYGFYEKRTHKVIRRKECSIEPEFVKDILEAVATYCRNKNITMYNESKHSGILRNVMTRVTALNEKMVVIVATINDSRFTDLAQILQKKHKINSVYLNVNNKKTNVVLTEEYYFLAGEKTITEKILGLPFKVSPQTFLQVNHAQCEKLYLTALSYAGLTGNENVIDAYCGMGSITLNLAKKAKHVYGIEIVESAIRDANKNKENNDIENVTFICGKCEDEIKKLVDRTSIDLIVFDPPRKGCDLSFLNTVIEMKIPKIVYISCNIASAARDVRVLVEAGYEIKEVTPVDLFPRTAHVESVCLLSLKDIPSKKSQ